MSEIIPAARILPGFNTETQARKRSAAAWNDRLEAKNAAGKRPGPGVADASGDVTRFLGRVRQNAARLAWAVEVQTADEVLLTAEEKAALVVDDINWQVTAEALPDAEPALLPGR